MRFRYGEVSIDIVWNIAKETHDGRRGVFYDGKVWVGPRTEPTATWSFLHHNLQEMAPHVVAAPEFDANTPDAHLHAARTALTWGLEHAGQKYAPTSAAALVFERHGRRDTHHALVLVAAERDECPLSDSDVGVVVEGLPAAFDTLAFIAACPRSGGSRDATACEVVGWRGRRPCGFRLGAWQRRRPQVLERSGSDSPARFRKRSDEGGAHPTPDISMPNPIVAHSSHVAAVQRVEVSAWELRLERVERLLGGLTSHVQAARRYVESDPQSSLTKSRIVLERLVHDLFRRKLHMEPRKREIGEMMNNHQFARQLPRRIEVQINSIRSMANLGAHGDEVTDRDALRVYEDLMELFNWYLDEVGTA